MHYLDKKQLEDNSLILVIYFHENMVEEEKLPFAVQLTSIQECRYFSPILLNRIIKNPNELIKNHNDFLYENWYLLTLKQTDWNTFDILGVENVSNSQNEFYRLH